jgi:type I restriction enzyme, S subunit
MIKNDRKWPEYKIKDVAEIISGSTPRTSNKSYYNGNILWATPKDLSGLEGIYLEDTNKKITTDAYKSCSTKLLPKNAVLFSSRAPIGLVAIAKKEMCTNQGFKNFICGETLDPLYLYYCLKALTPSIQHLGHGATFKEVSKELIGNFRIPVPPLNIQRKVASLLKNTECTREKRKQASLLTNEFLKSVFLDMFGDPVKNEKGWEKVEFRKIFTSIRYGTGSPPEYAEKGIPFIRATNVKKGTVIDNGIKYISPEEASKIKKCKVSKGDLIIVRSGVNAGDSALIPEKYDGAYAGYDLNVKLSYEEAVFCNYLINSSYGKKMLEPLKRRAGQPHLNADQIGSLEFIRPPKGELKAFCAVYSKNEIIKQKQQQSENGLNNLFNSLMQRVFG